MQGSEHVEARLPIELSADELDRVVAQIGRVTRTAGLEFALRIGALIIHHFYGGNTEMWRLRGPKMPSFRRLAEHPHLPMSPGALYRCVAIFELCDRLGAASRWRNLGPSHFRAVLAVDSVVQERLLSLANSERWTVRALQDEVARSKVARRTRGGRRAQSQVTRFLKTIRKCLVEHHEALNDVESVAPHELGELVALLDQTRASLDKISRFLHSAQKDERSIVAEI
jgi:hypothetical protein